jgi:hypothetical protein
MSLAVDRLEQVAALVAERQSIQDAASEPVSPLGRIVSSDRRSACWCP